MKAIKIYKAEGWKDYKLLDTGEGEKLEKFGKYSFVRPLESAVWKKTLKDEWQDVDGKFISSKTGEKAGWKMKEKISGKWVMEYSGIKFLAMPTPFRHFGFFPEQATQWKFIEEKIRKADRPIKFLNLFGYTGVASLFALRAGAEVVHVDASKQSLDWAKENQEAAGMAKLPMRIIQDDILKFLEKEIRRGNRYDAIILDPPKFGRGPKGETWKLEENLPKLLSFVSDALSKDPLFVILTSYTTDSSSLALSYALEEALKSKGGKVEQGELCLEEESGQKLVSLANTAIWSHN